MCSEHRLGPNLDELTTIEKAMLLNDNSVVESESGCLPLVIDPAIRAVAEIESREAHRSELNVKVFHDVFSRCHVEYSKD